MSNQSDDHTQHKDFQAKIEASTADILANEVRSHNKDDDSESEVKTKQLEEEDNVFTSLEKATAAVTAPILSDGIKDGEEEPVKAAIQSIKERDSRLTIYWHPACCEHDMMNHPESPDRVLTMLEYLHKEFPDDMFRLAPLVTPEQIHLFHTRNHLLNFTIKADKAERKMNDNGKISYQAYDSDTSVMHATRQAAFRAAGSIVACVDAVFASHDNPLYARSGFCCVRPPGHHAETNKVMGFCFFNGAGIAAKYAQHQYGESHGIKKVAVLDFDVHHGNGTEEGFLRDDTCFYGSTHEQDNFPGTGKDLSPNIGDSAKREQHRRIVNRYLTGGDHKKSRKEFFPKWQFVVDEMERFSPDLVIFSAGFDAHGDDPIGNCWLIDEDFEWATNIVLKACKRLNPSKPIPCISVLEGGYDVHAISRSAVLHCKALQRGYIEDDDDNTAVSHKGDEVAALSKSISEMDL
jgi:acetoin utilization deacetylase AcuC-like enzyme